MTEQDDLVIIEQYRQIVLQYERVNDHIAQLLEANPGGTEKMSKQDFARYRQMAHERDALYNEMRVLEQQLLDES